MSLNNANESDGSLLDLSKLSKESKKRRVRRKRPEAPAKPISNAPPTIFKNVELELDENLLNYVHKLEFLIDKSFNQIESEREKFKDFLYCISKNFDVNLLPLLKDLDSLDPLSEAKTLNFFEEVLKKYDPKLIPKPVHVAPRGPKPKMRNKVANQVISPAPVEKYNIIKFSLNNNLPTVNQPAPIIQNQTSTTPKKEKVEKEKKPRKRNLDKKSEESGVGRKKQKKEEKSVTPEINLVNPGNFMPQPQGFKNMNFPHFFNQTMGAMPEQAFGFMGNPGMMAAQEQEKMAMGLDLGQKLNLPFNFNLYSLLNDPNNKELIGLLNSAMMADTSKEMMQNNIWNAQFNTLNIDPNILKKMKDANNN